MSAAFSANGAGVPIAAVRRHRQGALQQMHFHLFTNWGAVPTRVRVILTLIRIYETGGAIFGLFNG